MKRSETSPRWMQFSLKSLLLVMLLVAAYFAGWSTARKEALRQKEFAVQQMERAEVAAREARRQAELAAAAELAARMAQQEAVRQREVAQAVMQKAVQQMDKAIESEKEARLQAEIAARQANCTEKAR